MRKLSVLLMVLLIVLSNCAFADSLVSMPALDLSKTGSLTVVFNYTDDGIVTHLSGAEISIVRVADVGWQGGGVFYTVLPQYLAKESKALDILLGDNAVAKSNLAETFVSAVSSYEKKQITNGVGQVVFNDLSFGMYLVVETSKSGVAEKYESFKPFIVCVPLASEGAWKYNVVSDPKTVVKILPTPSPSLSPTPAPDGKTSVGGVIQTGDLPLIGLISAIGISGFVLLIVLIVRRKRSNDKD